MTPNLERTSAVKQRLLVWILDFREPCKISKPLILKCDTVCFHSNPSDSFSPFLAEAGDNFEVKVDPQWVIAIATVAYVLATAVLLFVTFKVANAARRSADGALQSAEVTRVAFETVSRPYLGVSGVTLGNNINEPRWVVSVTWKNFGSLPAPDAAFRGQLDVSGAALVDETESGIEVFPGAQFQWQKDFAIERDRFDRFADGRAQLTGFAEIRYSVLGGQIYLHRSEFVFRFAAQRFDLVKASTTRVK
jgi:hypothetical protein